MKAAVLRGNREVSVDETDIGRLGPGQVLLRLEGCGICASNLPVWEGRPWFEYPLHAGAPGHEPWGRVAELGEATAGFEVGQRVTGLSYRAYAELDVADAEELIALPPELDDRPFPGEALGCVMNVFERAGIERGMHVAVVGAGFIGSCLIQVAVAAGAKTVAFSHRQYSLDQAIAQGAAAARPLDDVERDSGNYARVIECTGVQAGLDAASRLTAPGGRLVIAGFHQDGPRTVDMQAWNWKGIDIVNAHERSPARYRAGMTAAVEAVGDRRLDPWPLLSHRVGLQELGQAFRWMEERPDGFMKAILIT
jgi:threonine dehydrogenase-like Zn-dependent dehydrogenase